MLVVSAPKGELFAETHFLANDLDFEPWLNNNVICRSILCAAVPLDPGALNVYMIECAINVSTELVANVGYYRSTSSARTWQV